MNTQQFQKTKDGILIDETCLDAFTKAGIDTMDGVFAYTAGDELVKENIGKHRTRIMFTLDSRTFFLKRYQNTPKTTQLKNWLNHGKKNSTSHFDQGPADTFNAANISTPKTVAIGDQWQGGFEERSFIITEKLYNSQSLEKKLPDCFAPPNNHKKRSDFINELADFSKRFHETGLRHRDFYLAHIFLSDTAKLFMIDLQRVFKPKFFAERFRIKDIAQLHYSAPGDKISCADRLRFYKLYTGRKTLTSADRRFIHKVKAKAWKMADHDIKHGREVPFAK